MFLIVVCKTIVSQNVGFARKNIKTLSDSDTLKINFTEIIPSTVHEQILLERPLGKITTRLNNETKVYSIKCYIIGYKKEILDKDIHIILKDIDTDETMVAEIPSPKCFEIRETSRYLSFIQLREWFMNNIGSPYYLKFIYLEKPIPVTITGIGFFDFMHGQKRMAENEREIHPVLSIKLN